MVIGGLTAEARKRQSALDYVKFVQVFEDDCEGLAGILAV